jgi:hypothetical protein
LSSSSFLRLFTTALLIPALACMPGCSIFVSANQDLTIVPSEEAAEVYVNGKQVGTGTTTVKVKRGEDYAVMAKLGDRVASGRVGRKISGTGVADIVGGFLLLVPFLGVFSPGFWALNPDKVSLALPPSPGYTAPLSARPYSPVAPAPAAPADRKAPAVNSRPRDSTGSGDRLPARQGSRRHRRCGASSVGVVAPVAWPGTRPTICVPRDRAALPEGRSPAA